MLTRAQKEDQVVELREKFERATSVFVADYRGLGVVQIEELRGALRSAGECEYRVAKNSLLKRARTVLHVIAGIRGELSGDAWGAQFMSCAANSRERFLMLAAFEVGRGSADLPPTVDDFGAWLIARSRLRSVSTSLRLLYLQAEARFPDLAPDLEALWEATNSGPDSLEGWVTQREA